MKAIEPEEDPGSSPKKPGPKPFFDDPSGSIEHNGKVYFHLRDNLFFIRKSYGNRPARRHYYICSKCSVCGKMTMKDRSNNKSKSLSKEFSETFCSMSCKAESMKIKPGQKKLKRGSWGHIMTYCPDHPKSNKDGYVAEHRLIIEKKIGRLLTSEERVHHIDCDPHNNSVSNLVLCKNNTEHFLAHGSLNKCVKSLLTSGCLSFDRKSLKYHVPQDHL